MFVLVLVAHAYLQYPILLSEMQVMDDLQFYALSRSGAQMPPYIYFDYFAWHNTLLDDIRAVRVLYLLKIAGAAALCYGFLARLTDNRTIAVCSALLIFLSPHIHFSPAFLNGSYQVVFLACFFGAGWLLTALLSHAYSARAQIGVFLAYLMLLQLQLAFASSQMFMPLALLLLPAWFQRHATDRPWSALWFGCLATTLVGIALHYLSVSGDHAYAGTDGRVDTSILSLAHNGVVFFYELALGYFEAVFFHFPSAFEIARISIGAVALLVLITATAIAALLAAITAKLEAPARYAVWMLVVALGLSAGPIAALNVHHAWYFIASTSMLVPLVLLGLASFHRLAPAAFLVIALVPSLLALDRFLDVLKRSAGLQNTLISELRSVADRWPPDPELLLLLDQYPPLMGVNSPSVGQQRRLGYVRTITGRDDVRAAHIVRQDAAEIPYHELVSTAQVYTVNLRDGGIRQHQYLVENGAERGSYALQDFSVGDRTAVSHAQLMRHILTTQQPEDYLWNVRPLADTPPTSDRTRGGTSLDGATVHTGSAPFSDACVWFSLELRSQPPRAEDRDNADRTPPMPLRSNLVSIYQQNDGYRVKVEHPEVSYHNIKTNPLEWSRLEFAFTQNGLVISVDQQLAVVQPFTEPFTAGRLRYELGRGYRERFWRGEISDFQTGDEGDHTCHAMALHLVR